MLKIKDYLSSLPTLFIIAVLCSSKECAYLFSVILEFLCPKISESVFTSMPHSSARVANVCLKA